MNTATIRSIPRARRALASLAALCALLLSGACASTRGLSLDYEPDSGPDLGRGRALYLAPVRDERPAQREPGADPAALSSLSEDGDLVVRGGESLAQQLRHAMGKELAALGFRVVDDERQVGLELCVERYELTHGSQPTVEAEVLVSVLEPLGKVRERTRARISQRLVPGHAEHAWSALRREHPKLWAALVRSLVRENRVAQAALLR
jgi:hypothetical protein